MGNRWEFALSFCWFATLLPFTLFCGAHPSRPAETAQLPEPFATTGGASPTEGWGPQGCSASPSAVNTRKKTLLLCPGVGQPLCRDQQGLFSPPPPEAAKHRTSA